MTITKEQLLSIMPTAGARADIFLAPLIAAMAEFEINTPAREAAFLAEIAEESGELRYTRELASGKEYEGRIDLGNSEPGDGPRYKGRGLIQITGRNNYKKTGAALGVDLIANPELLEMPGLACRSAACWWQAYGLNELADERRFSQITKVINGGHTGEAVRNAYYQKAIQTLGLYTESFSGSA